MSGTNKGQPDNSGDFKEYTNGQSDLTTWKSVPADWVQVIGTGSTVVTTEAGAAAATPFNRTITTDSTEPAAALKVPIVALVSTTATRVRIGYGAPPPIAYGPAASLPFASLGPALAVSIANVSSLSGAQTIDGVSLVAGNRVYLALQTTGAQQGLWVVQTGNWTRPADWASGSSVPLGTQIQIAPGGTANFQKYGSIWYVDSGAVVDTDTIIAYPRTQKGQATLASASPSTVTVSVLWNKSTTTSIVTATNVTTAADGIKGVLTAAAGTGTLVLTGPNTVTDVVAWTVTNG